MARNEAARFTIQYDRLYVDNEIYIYNEVEEKVEKIKMTVPKGTYEAEPKFSKLPLPYKAFYRLWVTNLNRLFHSPLHGWKAPGPQAFDGSGVARVRSFFIWVLGGEQDLGTSTNLIRRADWRTTTTYACIDQALSYIFKGRRTNISCWKLGRLISLLKQFSAYFVSAWRTASFQSFD